MAYKITITKVETVNSIDRPWQLLYTDDVFEKIKAQNPDARQFGYEPKEAEEEKSTEIFKMVKDEIDLKEVIDALNK